MSSNNTSTFIWMRLFMVAILLCFILFLSMSIIFFFGRLSANSGDLGEDRGSISAFGSKSFDCTGMCYCTSNIGERRVTPGRTLTKGVSYTFVALSTVLAVQSARIFFQDDCKKHFSSEECPYHMIDSEVDNCEEREPGGGGGTLSKKMFDPFEMEAIGVVHTPYKKRTGMPISQAGARGDGAVIEVFEEFAPAIDDLEGYTHIYVTFVFHEVEETLLKVNPIFDPKTKRGIFSTRAPMRPNRIGLSMVEIVGVEGNRIRIDGIDVVDGTPVIDIKPYLPDFESVPDRKVVKTGWFGASEDQVKKKKFRSKLDVFNTDESKDKPKY